MIVYYGQISSVMINPNSNGLHPHVPSHATEFELALALIFNPFRGEFFWFYEVQRVDIFFENGRKFTSLVIGLYWTKHLN